MKTINFKLISLFLLAGLSACKKEEILEPLPVPQDMNTLQIVIDTLPEGNSYDASDLFAFISIVNDKNEAVLTNKKLSISFNGKYVTEKIKLDAGNYKINSFLISSAAGITRFATPHVNSLKASEIQKPLNIGFKLQNTDLLDVPVEVSRILSGDKSENFGYPSGAFNLQNTDSGDFIKVKLQAVISIGDINYDNIPAQFRINSWDAQGVLTVKDTMLAGGANEILLPKSRVKYQFQLSKWGISDEMTLTREQLTEGITYT